MRKKSEGNFFWASYADLMTSLFFIMLVLFVLSVAVMKKKNLLKEDAEKINERLERELVLQKEKLQNLEAKYVATENQLQKIIEIQNAVKELPSNFFQYDEKHKRFALNRQIKFSAMSSEIRLEDKKFLIDVGNSISSLIERMKNQYSHQNIKYMIIIEGMASKDSYEYNNELSYERALALYNLWINNHIYFDNSVCELQVAGSGVNGVGRSFKESENQQFLIQIVPKIGNIDRL